MRVLTISELKNIGGEPSGKMFSSYSDICKALVEVDTLRNELTNYQAKIYQDKFLALYAKVERFHSNEAPLKNGKKHSEVWAVRTKLKDSMQDELQYVKIAQLLDKMAMSGKALTSNSGRLVRERWKNGQIGFSFTTDGTVNAQYSGRSIAINPQNFWKSEKLAMGLIAHEFHHVLSGRPADTYADEYVAHWKQYTVMELAKEKFDNLNHWLLDDPSGYKLRGSLRNGRTEFARPEDAGAIWSGTVDNSSLF